MIATKTIGFAYPSSEWAAHFGFAPTGCYVIEVDDSDGPNEALAAFATLPEAEEFAESRIKYEWHPHYLSHPLPTSRFA